jgi:hypothetical protein
VTTSSPPPPSHIISATERLCDLYEIRHRIQFQKFFRRLEFPEYFHSASIIDLIIVKEIFVSTFLNLLFYQGELRHIYPQRVLKFRKIRCYKKTNFTSGRQRNFIRFCFIHCLSWTTNSYKKCSQKFISCCVFCERSNTVFCISILKY